MQYEAVTRLQLSQVETLVFAGGGNRCWWQAGVVNHWMANGWRLPPTLVGTSAGAAVAAAALTSGGLKRAFDACGQLFRDNPRVVERRGLLPRHWRFAHDWLYPAWLASFVNENTFQNLSESPQRLLISLTRPARRLGLGGSVVAGTLAYLVDKFVWNRLHPGLPRMLGLRQEFLDLHACSTLAEAQTLLLAAAAAPPMMRAQQVAGALAIDGGYLDSVPVLPEDEADPAGTLVLLTRHYPRMPMLFRYQGRHYLQPSQRVPVSTWDCTARTDIQAALALGKRDVATVMEHALVTTD
ncbi:patatin-like phospholipase family protein [Dyella sp. C9]|uniref:patatin-like phospholipase family protein n=1 Tax=Dyella sp. C9 TaxID=2202154 RepID=UPI0018E59CDD|nr:patatin-like phospholipase family protein [Dyella sp. C9]